MNLEKRFYKRFRPTIAWPESERRCPDEGVVSEEAMRKVAEAKRFV